MSENFQELESLLFDWESGALDESGVQRLRELLRNDGGARAQFVRLQMLTAAMQLEGDAGLSPLEEEADFATRVAAAPTAVAAAVPVAAAGLRGSSEGRANRGSRWLISALSLAVAGLAGWLVYATFSDSGVPSSGVPKGSGISVGPSTAGLPAGTADSAHERPREATSHGIALLTRLVDVQWEDRQRPLDVGASLSPGRLAIRAGHAQLEFFCGATVVVEGPAELLLESATRARVQRGRLRAHVPPAARGFSLEVADMKVVDLGTEFGLSVSPDGTNVQVFDGEIELHRPSDPKRLLSAGQAVIRTAEGGMQDVPMTPETFVDIAGLESLAQQQSAARYERWKSWSEKVRRDPRLIAYYAFDEGGDWERRLACSTEPGNRELDGAIVGAREVAGRWDQKRGLEFKQPADRVRVQIPGEYHALTLACWVKIDSLDRWYNSLFLTDGYDKGEPHWQILDTGQIYFSVRPFERTEQGPRDYKALSPSFWHPSMHGKWLHLAVSYDASARTITHYVNGEVLSRHEVPAEQIPAATRIGAASIGNWAAPTMPDAAFAVRNLNGSIDELAIFSAALTADEVKEMVAHGKP